MQEITLREMNQNFSRHMRAVEKGGEIIITRRGQPVARLVAVSASKKLTKEQEAARVRAHKRMMQGYHLGGERLKRETIYERRTDYN